MAALRDGSSLCFIHSERTSAARTRARAKGGATQKKSQTLPELTAHGPPGGTFEIPPIRHRGDIARTLLKLARAIASGEIDSKRGRLACDALRQANAAAADVSELADADGAPLGARELEDHELEYVIKNGHLPPDVVEFRPARWWVSGPVLPRPPIEARPATNDDPEN